MPSSSRQIDWQRLRDAFVQRPARPTYTELSAEFSVPLPTISVCASEEGWTSLRAQYLESRLKEADAASILLEAIKIDRSLIRSVSDLALVALSAIKRTVERLDETRAPSTNLEALNTAGFATANFTRALKDCGVVGLPKGMADGKEENGRWNPQMLSQINVTVQNLAAQAAKGAEDIPPAASSIPKPVGPTVDVKSD